MGDYEFDLQNADFAMTVKMEKAGGDVVVKMDPRITIKPKNMTVLMKNLFNGEAPQFSDIVHKFINNDPDRFLEVITPKLKKKVSVNFKKFINIVIEGVDP